MNDSYKWGGFSDYKPKNTTASDQLKNLKEKVKVDVVHLTVQNYSKEGYIEKEFKNRDKNDSKGFPRLSTEMVKSFYKNTPTEFRGDYIELNKLPHAF
ncbi:MAG: hypothetical protein Q9M91_06695 [Candidatus Dojkabacteria bacterium]|nr:hypothetical protein [Candidatus Dojkabacteria bacterium]MDQ7021484.1 hypothetical protein [Candidatus Dojkabacteria bacterium]